MIYFLILFLNLNLFANNFSIIESTFNNPENIYDNNLETSANSGDLSLSEQFLVINLKKLSYINKIEIFFPKEKIPDYKILGSQDYINWFNIIETIKDIKTLKEKNFYKNVINFAPEVCQFLKIIMPQDRKFQKTFGISEINISILTNVSIEILREPLIETFTNSCEIKWETDLPSLGEIRCGLSPGNFDKVQIEYIYRRNHKIALNGLLPGKDYYFQIINLLPDGKYKTTPLSKFKTKGIPFPEIEEIKIVKKEYNNLVLKIISNIETKIKIDYGVSKDKYENSIIDDKLSKEHSIKIDNLIPLTKYYFRIIATDFRDKKFIKETEFETGEYNIALGKKVEGTFTNRYIADVFQLEGDILSRVNDGSFDYKKGMAVSFDPKFSDQFIIIDLEKEEKIEKIITYWRALAYPNFYFIYVSNDKKNWKKVSTVKLTEVPTSMVEGSGIPMKIGEANFENLKARFVKIIILKDTPYYQRYPQYKFLQLMELKIYGAYQR